MAAVENEGLERLVQYLARHRISSPPAPSYPAAFTAINYTSLKHLVPRLIEEQRQLTDLADMDVSRLGPVPRPLEQILTHYVALKRRHSEKLAALAQAPKVP
jgi:hypothetical protein